MVTQVLSTKPASLGWEPLLTCPLIFLDDGACDLLLWLRNIGVTASSLCCSSLNFLFIGSEEQQSWLVRDYIPWTTFHQRVGLRETAPASSLPFWVPSDWAQGDHLSFPVFMQWTSSLSQHFRPIIRVQHSKLSRARLWHPTFALIFKPCSSARFPQQSYALTASGYLSKPQVKLILWPLCDAHFVNIPY